MQSLIYAESLFLNLFLEVQTPRPQNVTVFGNKVTSGVIVQHDLEYSVNSEPIGLMSL